MLLMLLTVGCNFFVTYMFIGILGPILFNLSEGGVLLLTIAVMGGLVGIGFSPIGESILRFLSGLREPIRQERAVFDSAFKNVIKRSEYEQSDFDLLVSEDSVPNAFAIGQRTVAITRGFLNLPVDEIEAVLAHELGHHKNGDCKRLLVCYIVGIIGQAALAGLSILGLLLRSRSNIFMGILGMTFWVFALLFEFIVLIPLHLANMFQSRREEHRADKYAYDLGYGDSMMSFFYRIMDDSAKPTGLMAVLSSTHPSPGKRIKYLEDLEEAGAPLNSYHEEESNGYDGSVHSSLPAPAPAPVPRLAPAHAFNRPSAAPTVLCQSCGGSNPSSARFCGKCGASQESQKPQKTTKTCAGCGCENKDTSRFCVRCGSSLS